MAEWYVYVLLAGAIANSFWVELVESTYLSVRPVSLIAASREGDRKAAMALRLTEQRMKLLTSTTLVEILSDVIIASATTLILFEAFGPVGVVIGGVVVTVLIMVFLTLIPMLIGIENPVRMAIWIAPSTTRVVRICSPVAIHLTTFARWVSAAAFGKPTVKEEDLENEFEATVVMLEKAGQILPDAGKLLRSTLASSKTTALDIMTPINAIVSVGVGGEVGDALKLMGNSKHPSLPVYDSATNDYVGVVTVRSLFRAFADGALNDNITKHMSRPVKVELGDMVSTIMDKTQKAGVSMAFVLDGERVVGIVTITDLLENLLGIRV